MKQSKTTLKELTACYRAVLKHGILCNAIALGLIASPVMADDLYYTWAHPDIDSYATIDGDVNYSPVAGSYNFITGTAMRNVVNGDVNLTLDGVTQTAKNNPRDDIWQETNVFGSVFLPSSGGYLYTTELGAPAPSDDAKSLQQWINGNVNVLVKNNSVIENSVIGVNFYAANTEITESGLSGKTTVTVENSTVNQSVRGTNYRDIDKTSPKAHVGDIELNVKNSLIKEEIVSAGSAASAGNVVINVIGNSVVGYTDMTATTKTNAVKDNWIIAGANRNGARISSTEVNLNTDGANNTIYIAGDVHTGSRDRRTITDDSITIPASNPDANSVLGNATLNIFGGGNVNVGGNLRAYQVAGDTTLNINNAIANVAGNVSDEFKTINMDENAKLNVAGALTLDSDANVNIVLKDTNKYSKINVGTLDANGANLNFLVSKQGSYNIVTANNTVSDFTWNPENALFDFSHQDGVLTATAKSANDIAESAGVSATAGKTMSALAQSDNAVAQQMSLAVQDAIARGDTDYVEHEVSKMNPSKSPVATSVAMSVQNQVLSAAGERMSLPLIGRSGGDVNADFGVWAKGMYNRSKYRDLFTGNTWGTSVGFDTDLNHSVILGLGYSYSQTDVDLHAYDMDIDSNTIFVYGQYRNSDWFINGTIAYTMSKHEQNKTVFGLASHPSYHVNSLSEQIMSGYHFVNGITPTLGLRYLDVHADSYFDGLTNVSDVNSTYLTGVFGVDFKNAWIAPNTALFWNPELHAALTYDMVSDSDMAVVMIPGAAAYTVGADNLSRVGGEFGIGLSAEYYYLTVSLNYDLNIHRDFTSQTGSVKVKYKF